MDASAKHPHADPKGLHASDIILATIAGLPGERLTLRSIADALGDRGVALALLLFALPNCIPAPPGLGSILGIPLFIIGLCLARNRPLWLPGFIADRSVARVDLLRILTAAMRRLEPVERRLRPRLTLFVSQRAERLLGVFVMLLAAVVALPFPLTNLVPAIGTALIALGLVERDGLIVVAGLVVGVVGVVLASTVLGAFVIAPLLLWRSLG